MNDWLVIADSIPQLMEHHQLLLQLFTGLENGISWEKLDLVPKTKVQYLGVLAVEDVLSRLLNHQISESGDTISCIPHSTSIASAVASWPHGISRVPCSTWQSQDASPSVAALKSQVLFHRQTGDTSSYLGGFPREHQMVDGGQLALWNPSSVFPSIPSSVS